MKIEIGTKATTPMPGGLMWPAVAVGDVTETTQTVVDRTTNQPVEIIVSRADFVSLRETKEGEKYLAFSNEVINFGYRAVALPRFDAVVGLDVAEDGTILTLADLLNLHAVSYGKFAAEQFAARKATAAADL